MVTDLLVPAYLSPLVFVSFLPFMRTNMPTPEPQAEGHGAVLDGHAWHHLLFVLTLVPAARKAEENTPVCTKSMASGTVAHTPPNSIGTAPQSIVHGEFFLTFKSRGSGETGTELGNKFTKVGLGIGSA